MKPFTYLQATDVPSALRAISSSPDARFIGGGTNLVDLMKYGVEQPAHLIDIGKLPLANIEPLPGGGVRIGALARNSDIANHLLIREKAPLLAEAIVAGASPQLRNAATAGGNLMQRTRCYYFYDTGFTQCNKRIPGSGCAARDGLNRIHAILGTSDKCIATNPSDMSVALAAIGATVQVQGNSGPRSIPFADFHRLPGETPQIDTNLNKEELITAIDVPGFPFALHYCYLKVRDRGSYAFALISVAAMIDVRAGKIHDVRFALGGVAPKPWRVPAAEQQVIGQEPGAEAYGNAADVALKGARTFPHNAFKLELARRSIIRALTTAAVKGERNGNVG